MRYLYYSILQPSSVTRYRVGEHSLLLLLTTSFYLHRERNMSVQSHSAHAMLPTTDKNVQIMILVRIETLGTIWKKF